MLRAAGVLSWLLAAMFGPLCVPAMVSIARGDGAVNLREAFRKLERDWARRR